MFMWLLLISLHLVGEQFGLELTGQELSQIGSLGQATNPSSHLSELAHLPPISGADSRELADNDREIDIVIDNGSQRESTLASKGNHSTSQSLSGNGPNLESHSDSVCPICLENFEVQSSSLPCSLCNNPYHQTCVNGWLERGETSCPTCRKEIERSMSTPIDVMGDTHTASSGPTSELSIPNHEATLRATDALDVQRIENDRSCVICQRPFPPRSSNLRCASCGCRFHRDCPDFLDERSFICPNPNCRRRLLIPLGVRHTTNVEQTPRCLYFHRILSLSLFAAFLGSLVIVIILIKNILQWHHHGQHI